MDEQTRKVNATKQLARQYINGIMSVWQGNKMSGKILGWNLAPRHIVVGARLADPTRAQEAMSDKVLLAIGHSAALGMGGRDPYITATLSKGAIMYEFRMPETYKWGLRPVRLWRDISVLDEGFSKSIGVGLALNNQPVPFIFDRGAPHTVVSGKSGSGKTTLLKTIIYRLAQNHDTTDLKLMLGDVKGDFEVFADLAHLVYQPTSYYLDIERMVAHFNAEFQRRLSQKLYEEARWVLVLDEADHHTVIGNEKIAAQLLDISLRGRAVQMNLIIGTHVASKSSLGALNAELSYRFHGATANSKESGQVEGNLSLHKLAGQGDFYHVLGGEKIRFQAAITPAEAIDSLPKAQIPKVPSVLPDSLDTTAILETTNPPHRPRIEADPQFVAHYLLKGPENVSVRYAKEHLGLTRTAHERNKSFAIHLEQQMREIKGHV